MRVYIKHVFYWMSSYKPCSHKGDPKERQGNKKAKLNKPVDGNRTHGTLPARMQTLKMFKHKRFYFHFTKLCNLLV